MMLILNTTQNVVRWPYISWLDLNCICSSFSFISLLLHFLIIGILIMLIKKQHLTLSSIFSWLLIGLIISTIAEFFDFYHNLLVAKAGKMVFIYYLDIVQEIIKGLGFFVIFISLLKVFKTKKTI